ncbi:MAG: Nif3-like dinuclear metal center hexameric protein [Trueperaceae bacterium]|nr:Nif3-like dinuclear metal center hexameric protein [Trueperaceae bacterium]
MAFSVCLHDVAAFLDGFFEIARYDEDVNGIFRDSARPVSRLGVGLEPSPTLPDQVRDHHLDALVLHRPWKLSDYPLPDDIGVLAYHLPFDEHLTVGYNLRLADVLQLRDVEVLGEKDGRPLGMIGTWRTASLEKTTATVRDIFGGLEARYAGRFDEVSRVAVVGAMTPELIDHASKQGADVYVTGQYRKRAEDAVRATGVSVLEVGHARSERWGVGGLEHLLRERFNGVATLNLLNP